MVNNKNARLILKYMLFSCNTYNQQPFPGCFLHTSLFLCIFGGGGRIEKKEGKV